MCRPGVGETNAFINGLLSLASTQCRERRSIELR